MIRLNSERSRPVSVRADFHRGLDESTAATGNRLFARGESGAARAARRSPTSFHGRLASPARGASQRARPTRAVADRNDRHPWDSAGLAPQADRSKVRSERQPWSRPTAHGRRHRITGGANGCREPCTHIVGALLNLGHNLARGTVANILKRNGIEPAPERSRKTTWKEFLAQHWEMIVAADFFTIEVWTAKGLQRFLVLFFIELSSRRVEIGGISAAANGLWMSQIARNLTDSVEGLLTGKRYLIHDRDPLFTDEFLRTLKDAGVESVKLPPRSPNLKAYASHCTSFALPDVTSSTAPRSESLLA